MRRHYGTIPSRFVVEEVPRLHFRKNVHGSLVDADVHVLQLVFLAFAVVSPLTFF